MAGKGNTMPEFAKVDDVKDGDTLIADGGFNCLIRGKKYLVHNDKAAPRGLHIICMEGRHYLVGQLDKHGERYVGLHKENADGARPKNA